MKSRVRPNCCLSATSSFRTVACTETSRPEVGSSRITTRGLQRQDAREADAALLAAGDLVRIEIESCVFGQADGGERSRARARRVRRRDRLVWMTSGSSQRAADRPARIERRPRDPGRRIAGASAPRARRARAGSWIAAPSNGSPCRRRRAACPSASCRAWTCRSPIRRRCRGSRRPATARSTPSTARTARPSLQAETMRDDPASRAGRRSCGRSRQGVSDADGSSAPHAGAARSPAAASSGSRPTPRRSADGSGSRRAARAGSGSRRECRCAALGARQAVAAGCAV